MIQKLTLNIPFRRINNLLLGLIIGINLYTILAPLAPSVIFWWEKNHTNKQQELTQMVRLPASSKTSPSITAQNSLVVPSMLLNTPLYEGSIANEYKTLDKGVWRWPLGSTPDKGGNTIFIGHRFTYTNPRGIFYQLDKVKVGDQIGVFWSEHEYIYLVSSISVVEPTDISILNQTSQSEITLYTCTPTWNPKKRLVVIAQLQSTRTFKAS